MVPNDKKLKTSSEVELMETFDLGYAKPSQLLKTSSEVELMETSKPLLSCQYTIKL